MWYKHTKYSLNIQIVGKKIQFSVFLGAYEEVSHEKGLPATYLALHPPAYIDYGHGHIAPINHYPWMASMRVYGVHRCSATIISATRLLTAAQCTIGKVASAIQYRIGSRDNRTGGQYMYVAAIFNHPEYNAKTLRNDIAVVWLEKHIDLALPGVAFIGLPKSDDRVEVDTITAISGWEYAGPDSNLMRYSRMSIISNEECDRYYRGGVLDSMLCAKVPEPEITKHEANTVITHGHYVFTDSAEHCQGDAGGPVTDIEKEILIGIVVWGHGCKIQDRPGVYTRVASYREWIDTVM